MCPTEEESASTNPRPRRSWNQENPEAVAESRRRYREEHAERLAAEHRAWRERNLERSRELNRESAQRQAHRRRLRLKKNAHGREWYAENREAERERARRFRAEHPDKVREYQRRYKERHPERARRSSREAAQRHRDANADEIRARERVAAADRRKQHPNAHREWYERNLERQRARSRDAARLRRRLKKLGLPPSRIHRLFAEERRAHDAAAEEYFVRRRSVDERGAIAAEAVDARALDVPKVVAKRRRVVLRERSTPRRVARDEQATDYNEDLPVEVVRWRRARDLQALRETHEALVEKIRAERPQILAHHRERNEARLREEVRLDSIARTVRGLSPYEVDREVEIRVNDEVTAIVNQQLRAARHRTIARAADIAVRRDRDEAAPHRVPGTGLDTGARLQ
ncbi:hypothetical protein JF531_07700 [Microbacterium esteraromaticum]|uniref:hypothetical protein n=1 Tax=Microbacterium esteraromaticum TaxID=57043 RepID=UPI001A8E46E0|nr:hypothetical protein [Microbacterium esteraromaticum]MBN8424404.1 hypothetical protein [Microbacterium esteraromaticum]